MSGIGFLGAGAILKEGVTVTGLTTAATLWVSGAIGLSVGVGFWLPAVLTTVVVVVRVYSRIGIPSIFFGLLISLTV